MTESQNNWIDNLKSRLTCEISQKTSLFWLLWQCWKSEFRCAEFEIEKKNERVFDWTMLNMKQKLHDSNEIDVLIEKKKKKKIDEWAEKNREKKCIDRLFELCWKEKVEKENE